MDHFEPSAKIVNIFAVIFPCVSIYIYTKLLISIFWFKTIKKVPELSLFYCHFVFDILSSVATLFNMIIMLLRYCTSTDFFHRYPNFSFFFIWAVYLFGSIRAVLVLVIAIDRVTATYFPILFFKYRKTIPMFVILIILMTYAVFDGLVLFVFCGQEINVPPGCVSILCAISKCYLDYWITFDKIVYCSIIGLTLMLSFKLFVLNKYKKQTINVELKRANRLALIDTCIIVVFDLTPTFITSTISYLFPYIGPWNAFFKMLGFVVEGNLVVINLKKRYKDEKRTSKLFLVSGKQDSGKL